MGGKTGEEEGRESRSSRWVDGVHMNERDIHGGKRNGHSGSDSGTAYGPNGNYEYLINEGPVKDTYSCLHALNWRTRQA